MMREAANEAIMVSGKSHLSLKAPVNSAGSAADVEGPETELTLIYIGSRGRAGEMKDAKTHQPN